MSIIVIVDYGTGNLNSVKKRINLFDHEVIVTSELNLVEKAEKLILPGVGHFRNGMIKLRERNLLDVLNKKVLEEKTPILGICLGMQLFSRYSEEGNSEGLGWIDAVTVKFNMSNIRFKVPHIGWNSIEMKKDSQVFKNLPNESQFYFVHSYHVKCYDNEDILATTKYGYEFVSVIQKGNIFGTQFHPEKSLDNGERVFLNFLSL